MDDRNAALAARLNDGFRGTAATITREDCASPVRLLLADK
jgi:hypothetical protein